MTQDGRAGALEFNLDPRVAIRRLFVYCVSMELLLVFLDYHMNYGRWTEIRAIRKLFDISLEDALPSWFATTQAFLICVTLWLIWIVVRRQGVSGARSAGWFVLASFFTWIAIDDGARVHERLGSGFRKISQAGDPGSFTAQGLDAFPSYSWQFFLLPIFAGLGLFTFIFLWRELKQWYGGVLVFAAMSCLAFAVGLDFIEGLDAAHPWNLYTRIAGNYPSLHDFTTVRFSHPPYDTLRHFSKSLEEFIEMFGMTILWTVFLTQLGHGLTEVRLRVGRGLPATDLGAELATGRAATLGAGTH